jgi:hypothetical protein
VPKLAVLCFFSAAISGPVARAGGESALGGIGVIVLASPIAGPLVVSTAACEALAVLMLHPGTGSEGVRSGWVVLAAAVPGSPRRRRRWRAYSGSRCCRPWR